MLLAGEPPFYSSHCDDWTMQKILNEPLDINSAEWDDISAECKDFVPAPQVLGPLGLLAIWFCLSLLGAPKLEIHGI